MTAHLGLVFHSLRLPCVLLVLVHTHRWSTWYDIKYVDNAGFADPHHVSNAFKQYSMAPLWMTNVQPKGTPARLATWDGNARAPLSLALYEALVGFGPMAVGGPANFTAAKEWFVPRYAAWKADPSKALTQADVLLAWQDMFTTGSKRIQNSTMGDDVTIGSSGGVCREQGGLCLDTVSQSGF